MKMGSLDTKNVDLIPNLLFIEQQKDMTLFTIIDSYIVKTDSQQVRMVLEMKRKITSEMMTTYFPSILLMLITFATTFFKPFFFEAALSVNLTTMLVMTTIFISKMEGLPPTSETKMIDYWLILCQLVPFIEVVLLTAIESLREEEDKEEDLTNSKNQTINHKVTLNIVDVSMYEETSCHEDFRQEKYPMEEETSSVQKRGFCMVCLKNIGNYHCLFHNKSVSFLSEKMVLPGFVVVMSFIYFGIATTFYQE